MLDVLRLLQSLLDEADIRMRVIRRGGLPQPLIPERPRRAPVEPTVTGPFTLAFECRSAIDADIARFRAHGAGIMELRTRFWKWLDKNGLAALLPDLTEQRLLQSEVERRFRRSTHDRIADYRRLKAAGQIEEISGAVQSISARGSGGAEIDYVSDGQSQSVWSALVIDTSGPRDPRALEPQSRGLLARG